MSIFLGIDPGKNGGLAVVIDGESHVIARKMPDTERDLWDTFSEIRSLCARPITFALIEKVGSGLFAGKAGKMGASSAFTFGRGYGLLRGLLIAGGIPFDEVTPQRWQKAMGCMTKGDKNVSKAKAQQLWPHMKITHAIADSMLIAEHCRQTFNAKGNA